MPLAVCERDAAADSDAHPLELAVRVDGAVRVAAALAVCDPQAVGVLLEVAVRDGDCELLWDGLVLRVVPPELDAVALAQRVGDPRLPDGDTVLDDVS